MTNHEWSEPDWRWMTKECANDAAGEYPMTKELQSPDCVVLSLQISELENNAPHCVSESITRQSLQQKISLKIARCVLQPDCSGHVAAKDAFGSAKAASARVQTRHDLQDCA